MSISTFGSFTQARLGIYAAQAGLSITGNNIANINTPGYTRQKLIQTSFYSGGSDRYYSSTSISIGNGVLCKGTSQMRDPYLDLRYRNESASVGAMSAKLGSLQEIQRILDETGKGEEGFGVLGAQLNDFFKQLENLNNHTGLAEYDIQVRSSAESLSKLFNSYSSQLREAELNAKDNLAVDVKSINSILESIRGLNNSIRKSELHGDPALELRDERNLLIDQLSAFIKIDVYEEPEIYGGAQVNKLVIRLGNANPDPLSPNDQAELINGVYGTQISIPETVTDANGVEVPNDNLLVTLSALKDSKDRVYQEGLPKESHPVQLADNDLYGALQSEREFLTESGEFSPQSALDADPKAAVKRGIPFYRKALDLLANQFAATFNEANQGYIRNEKGEYVTAVGDVILDADGNAITVDTPMTPDLKNYLDTHGGQFLGTALFSNRGDGNDTTGITAENISISKNWATGPQIINSFVQHGDMGVGSTDSSNIGHMLVLMGTKIEFKPGEGANPDSPMFRGTFNEMWDNLGTVLGNDMMTTNTMLNTYQASSLSLDTSRDGVSSVDLNDEAASLMQYSKSYSAACRLMTTIDSILDKLIDGTGMTR